MTKKVHGKVGGPLQSARLVLVFGIFSGRVPAVFFSGNCGFSVFVVEGIYFIYGVVEVFQGAWICSGMDFHQCFQVLGKITRCSRNLEESTLLVGGLHGWGENLWPRWIPCYLAPFCMISPLCCLI